MSTQRRPASVFVAIGIGLSDGPFITGWPCPAFVDTSRDLAGVGADHQ